MEQMYDCLMGKIVMAAKHACQLTFFVDEYIKSKIDSCNLCHLHGVSVEEIIS